MKNNNQEAERGTTPRKSTWRWFKEFQYDENNDHKGDVRNALLVIAALIAGVTFQAGVNPPVWQNHDEKDIHIPGTANYASQPPSYFVQKRISGTAIYALQPPAYFIFLISNTLALSSSLLIIVSLTYKFPLRLEISVATSSMLVTYGSAVFAVTANDKTVRFRYILFAAALPLLMRFFIQTYKKFFKKEKQEKLNPDC